MKELFVVLSKSKVHSVCDTEELAEIYLQKLRDKCGLVDGYDRLWKKEYRIEKCILNNRPSILYGCFF